MFANNPAHSFASSIVSGGVDASPSAAKPRTTQEMVDLLREKYPRLQGSDKQLGKLIDSVRGLMADPGQVSQNTGLPSQPDW